MPGVLIDEEINTHKYAAELMKGARMLQRSARKGLFVSWDGKLQGKPVPGV